MSPSIAQLHSIPHSIPMPMLSTNPHDNSEQIRSTLPHPKIHLSKKASKRYIAEKSSPITLISRWNRLSRLILRPELSVEEFLRTTEPSPPIVRLVWAVLSNVNHKPKDVANVPMHHKERTHRWHRPSTLYPPGDIVAGLQPAIHIHHRNLSLQFST